MLAPFYFKLGDYLATFIENNTDEFGNVQKLPSDIESSDDEEAEESDPNEESKDEVEINANDE